jgi:hypothetical protein
MSTSSRRAFLQTASGTLALPLLPSLALGKEKGTAPQRLVCVGTQLGWYKPDFFASNPDARLRDLIHIAVQSDVFRAK